MDEIKRKFKSIPRSAKVDSDGYVNNCFKIFNARIDTDNGVKNVYNYQYEMLNLIINNRKTYLSNQSYALYGNYCFNKSRKIGKFQYNMILLENSHVYLYNLTTGTLRRIYYDLEKKVSRKRKRN